MNVPAALLTLFLTLLAELYILGTILGFWSDRGDLIDYFLGYFIALFWFMLLSLMVIEYRSRMRSVFGRTKSLVNTLGTVSMLIPYIAFIYLTYGAEITYLSNDYISSGILNGVTLFSTFALLQFIPQLVMNGRVSSNEREYQRRKLFHNNFVKLGLGLCGILLVTALPLLDPNTYAFITPSMQSVAYVTIFIFFAVQDTWFWFLEQKYTKAYERIPKVAQITKILVSSLVGTYLLALLFGIVHASIG